MIFEIVCAGLVISACLAIFLEEAVYSVGALAGTFLLTSLLYALSGASFAAIFQFALGIGTIAILFLEGESLSEKPLKKTTLKTILAVAFLGAGLSLPAFFFSISSQNTVVDSTSFGDALWNLRAVDVVLQGLVILTLALGIAIVLYEKKKPVKLGKGDQ
jgi:NADH:ubiquinone oxidoreductase subunit 6 (subunit J)